MSTVPQNTDKFKRDALISVNNTLYHLNVNKKTIIQITQNDYNANDYKNNYPALLTLCAKPQTASQSVLKKITALTGHAYSEFLPNNAIEAYINNPETSIPTLNEAQDFFADAEHTPSPPTYWADLLEILRSFLSGPGKSLKTIDHIFKPAETKGSDGQYHESLPILILAGIGAVFYAIILAARALAKGFGRMPVEEENASKNKKNEMETKKSNIKSDFCINNK